jgi:hypothetical protein
MAGYSRAEAELFITIHYRKNGNWQRFLNYTAIHLPAIIPFRIKSSIEHSERSRTMPLTGSSFGFAQDDTWVNFNVQMILPVESK